MSCITSLVAQREASKNEDRVQKKGGRGRKKRGKRKRKRKKKKKKRKRERVAILAEEPPITG